MLDPLVCIDFRYGYHHEKSKQLSIPIAGLTFRKLGASMELSDDPFSLMLAMQSRGQRDSYLKERAAFANYLADRIAQSIVDMLSESDVMDGYNKSQLERMQNSNEKAKT